MKMLHWHATLLIVALASVNAVNPPAGYTYSSIIYGGDGRYCLTVSGAYTNQAPIVLSKCTDIAQMWILPQPMITKGYIKLGDGTSNFCLDGKNLEPNDIWLWECNGYPWQQWLFYVDNDNIHFDNGIHMGTDNGLCLTVPASVSTEELEGVQVGTAVCDSKGHPLPPNQSWGIINAG